MFLFSFKISKYRRFFLLYKDFIKKNNLNYSQFRKIIIVFIVTKLRLK